MDEKAQKVRLSLHQAELLNSLAQEEVQANGELVQGLLDGVYVITITELARVSSLYSYVL